MALQLTGAFKRDSLANLQVRLPAIVIGGGLTGIDTATELLAYYPVQVEKILERWETLAAEQGEDALFAALRRRGGGDRARVPRARAGRPGRAGARRGARAKRPTSSAGGGLGRRLARLPQGDGGLARLPPEPRGDRSSSSRRACASSRSWRRSRCVPDARGALWRCARAVSRTAARATSVELPARTLFVAAGTSPNIIYETRAAGHVRASTRAPRASRLPRRARRRRRRQAAPRAGHRRGIGFFTSYHRDGHTVTFYGDNHPGYAGSVVKAMASAKDGYPHVAALFARDIARPRSPTDSRRATAPGGRSPASSTTSWRPTVA